jgi:hypothetical protein
VAGGYSTSGNLDSTETLQLSSTGTEWILRAGKLPSRQYGLRGVTLGNIFYVSGGDDFDEYDNEYDFDDYDTFDFEGGFHDSILAWTEATEEWTKVGTMTTARYYHGVASVPISAVQEWCG